MDKQSKKTVQNKKDKPQSKKKIRSNQKKTDNKNRKKNNKQQNKEVKTHVPPHVAVPAAGVVSTIEITPTMCPYSRSTWSLALITRIASLDTAGLDNIYYVYQAMDADFVNVTKNKVPVLSSRPAFVNTLFELIKAKTVITPQLKVSYQFDGQYLSGQPSPVIDVNGYKYYMYIQATQSDSQLQVQTPPASIGLDAAIDYYNSALPSLVGSSNKRMLQIQPVDEGSKVFEKDASAYAARSVYCQSAGSCPSGGYASAELEVYGKALSTLSVFVELPETVVRTAHNLQFASLDATGAFGMPFNDGFSMLDYSTKLPPIVKYIDFAQCWQLFSQWFAESLRKGYDVEVNKDTIMDYLAAPVPTTYAIIAFRQTMMKYFQTAQACTQFQSYAYADNKVFNGLRVSSNTVSRVAFPLNLPNLMVENFRALAPKRYCSDTFKGEKYCRWYLPCFGLFADAEFLVPTISINDVAYPVFASSTGTPAEASVNFIDGSTSQNVYDFNSPCVNTAIAAINELTAKLCQTSGDYANLEGSSDFNLLAFTRYDQVTPNSYDAKFFEETPKWARNAAFQQLEKQYLEAKRKYELTRTKSSPAFSFKTLGAEVTNLVPRYFSSGVVLTKELLSALQNLIVPSVITLDVATTVNVTTSGFQSAFSETQSYSVNQNTGTNAVSMTVAQIFANLGKALAPGTATQPTSEVARIMTMLQMRGEGGFLDAALSGILTFVEKL